MNKLTEEGIQLTLPFQIYSERGTALARTEDVKDQLFLTKLDIEDSEFYSNHGNSNKNDTPSVQTNFHIHEGRVDSSRQSQLITGHTPLTIMSPKTTTKKSNLHSDDRFLRILREKNARL